VVVLSHWVYVDLIAQVWGCVLIMVPALASTFSYSQHIIFD